jgi:hypothetical protein
MPLGFRRMGRIPTSGYDIWSSTGTVIVRAIKADVAVGTYATSLTATQLIDRVAQEHHVDSDGVRVTAHNAISG